MRNVPIDLQRSQHVLQDADRLLAIAAALCAHSRALIARGKARAEARACASMTSEAPPARGGELMAPQRRHLCQSSPWWSRRVGEVRCENSRLRQHAHALRERSQLLRHRYLFVVCAWCMKRLRWQRMPDTVALDATSHSICPPCQENVLRELGASAPR